MAIEKEIKIKVDTTQANKNVDGLNDSVEQVGTTAEESGDKASKAINGVSKSSKGAEKSAKGASLGVKAIGTAIKAAGIGLALALFAKLAEVMSKNQKVSDALSVVFGTVSNVLGQVVNGVVDAISAVYEATNGFNSLGKVLSGLVTLALTPLKLGFYGVKLGLQEAQLAWEESFFGDKDPETIKQLNKRIEETRKNIIEVGADAIQAGSDVYNNFSTAIDEVTALGTAGINALSDVSIKAAYEQSKLNVELTNTAALAEASLQGLIEKYDRQAEQLRQVRDDEAKSIKERIDANEELGRVLDEQAKAQKALAGTRVALAQQELALNKDNIEAQKAVIEAQNEVLAIEAQVEGFRSEQLVNRNSLLREQKEILRELNEIGKADLELAKEEAAQLRDDRIAQIELQVEDEKEKFRLLAAARKDYDDTIAALDLEAAEKAKKVAEANEQIAKKEADAKVKNIGKVSETIDAFAELANEKTAEGKTLAVASSTINTFRGVSDALAATTVTPFETALKFANAAAIGVAGLKNVKDILKVQVPNGGGGGSAAVSSSATQGATAPAFNLTANSGVNQLAGDVSGAEPVRAYVVGSDVTTQQQMDMATFGQAGLG